LIGQTSWTDLYNGSCCRHALQDNISFSQAL